MKKADLVRLPVEYLPFVNWVTLREGGEWLKYYEYAEKHFAEPIFAYKLDDGRIYDAVLGEWRGEE